MKKIKKGFTLIELLAVIVILSIILIIAVPAILKNINDSKKSVFQESADLIIKVIDQIIISDSLESDNILEQEITDSYRCITSSEATSFGLNPTHYDIGYDNGSDTTCSQVAYRDGKTYVRLVANITGKFAGIQPLSSPGYLPSPIECFTFDIPTAKITGYNLTNPSCSREVSIPEKINGVAVRIIGDSSFEGKQITGVEIPYGVTTIEIEAFWMNQLTEVTIPDSVTTIGKEAFSTNQLTKLILPDSVTTLNDCAFCDNQIESVIISNNLTTLNHGIFYNNQLTSLVIPDGVTNISTYAFQKNQLTNITIPASVTTIGAGAFNDNKLPDSQAFIYARNSNGTENTNTIVSYGGTKRINIVIPSSVTTIGDWSFNCNNIISVTIPQGIVTIGEDAFSYNQLTSLTIPSSVTTIEYSAFNNNQLPDSQAFIYARNSNGTDNTSILVSYGGAKRVNIAIPSSVTTIRDWALYGNSIPSITIPNNITTIGYGSFYDNYLPSITIPNSVTNIESHAFRYNNITQGNAQIDNSVGNVTIGSSVFNNNGPSQMTTITPTYLR